MRRDPELMLKIEYTENIKVSDFFPLLLWRQCEKCKHEFKREKMYECRHKSIMLSFTNYNYGCTNCFEDKQAFLKYLLSRGIVLNRYFLPEFLKQKI